jgi:hypothetical protein
MGTIGTFVTGDFNWPLPSWFVAAHSEVLNFGGVNYQGPLSSKLGRKGWDDVMDDLSKVIRESHSVPNSNPAPSMVRCIVLWEWGNTTIYEVTKYKVDELD